jgi:hypothetical protein
MDESQMQQRFAIQHSKFLEFFPKSRQCHIIKSLGGSNFLYLFLVSSLLTNQTTGRNECGQLKAIDCRVVEE